MTNTTYHGAYVMCQVYNPETKWMKKKETSDESNKRKYKMKKKSYFLRESSEVAKGPYT